MSRTFKNKVEFYAAYQEFYESHPEAKVAKVVDCLNLVMRREYAEQILRGEKKLEFRACSDFYQKRIIDKEVEEYMQKHKDDEDVLTFCNDIRQVKMIHFHNYNNSWFLDMECTFNDAFSIIPNDIRMLNGKYGCHDYDDDLKRMEAVNVPIEERPWIFYFVCGKVIDTNLEVKPKEEEFVEICGGKIIEFPEIKKVLSNDKQKEVITFKVNKEVFDDIVNGRLAVFEKEIKVSNISQFFITDEKGNVKEINDVPQFKRYDAIQFINKDKSYTCLIDNADIVYFDFDNGYKVPYSELEDDVDYTDCLIEYTLGDEVKQK